MAVISAFNAGPLLVQIDNPNVPHEQFNVGTPTIDQGFPIVEVTLHGVRQSGQPRAVVSREISAFIAPTFEQDFYHRVWLIPSSTVNFGFVPSDTEREFVLWNAWRTTRELDSITPANDTGIGLDPTTAPTTYLPLEYRTYTVSAGPEGPPTIEATYTYSFESGAEVRVLTVLGTRVVGWVFEPNWLEPVIERAAWLTDVQQKRDGSEQRRALRAGARVAYEFLVDVDGDRRRLLENVLHGAGSRIFSLPIWTDKQMTTSPLGAGATSIAIPTAGTDFREGGLGMLLDEEGRFEAFEVESVEAELVTLKAPLALAWPANTAVYPARAAYMLEGRGNARMTRNYARGRFRFESLRELERDPPSATLYRSHPVMTEEPNWREPPEIDHARSIETVDYGVGRPFVFDPADVALPTLRVTWSALDRASANYMRDWLWARKGRALGAWIPTWADDLRVVDYDHGSATLDVAYAGVKDYADLGPHRRDIRIETTDGTVYYRRISQVQTLSAGVTERLTLDAQLGEAHAVADFSRVSWLMFMRLDQDTIEIAWHTLSVAEAVITFRGPRNDL